jgi:hypothetical protein
LSKSKHILQTISDLLDSREEATEASIFYFFIIVLLSDIKSSAPRLSDFGMFFFFAD